MRFQEERFLTGIFIRADSGVRLTNTSFPPFYNYRGFVLDFSGGAIEGPPYVRPV
jgi:hypothetical protein